MLPAYFAHRNLQSFTRQLKRYGYRCIKEDSDEPAGSYFHAAFRRGRHGVARHPRHRRRSDGAFAFAARAVGDFESQGGLAGESREE